jgi:hypothetical protein
MFDGLPTGNALLVFVLCMLAGVFVIVKFCLDQFDKPTVGNDENDPWKFLVTRFLTSREQYLTGFTVYCGIILFIFVSVSLIGPGPIFEIFKAIGAAATQGDLPQQSAAPSTVSLRDYPTFPIVVAFYIVGLNPNLPKALDFEIIVRRLGHRIAYIPTSMHQIFNFMRFSEFDLSDDLLQRAWDAADLKRAILDAPDFKALVPLFDRSVLLYARAGMLSGDLTFDGADNLPNTVNLEVFKQYREEIRDVGVNLQAINARLSDLATATPAERRHAVAAIQRDLVRSLEALYVIFAAATTTKGGNQLADRLRAIGFKSAYPPPPEIPWNPLLKVMGAATVVMAISFYIAVLTLFDSQQTFIPTDTGRVAYMLAVVLIVHLVTIWQALATRARLIGQDKYFSETGYGQPTAYIRLFLRCAVAAWLLNLVLYLPYLLPELVAPGKQPPSALIVFYLTTSLAFIIPATCGAMTAFSLDRPSDTLIERLMSGGMQAAAMAIAAIIYVELASGRSSFEYYLYHVVLYGGLGFVIGFLLPSAIKRYWRAQEVRLPEKTIVLRNAVLSYFRDIHQFMEWLNTRNDRLSGRRPLDVLSEERGLQELTALVTATRSKIATAG